MMFRDVMRKISKAVRSHEAPEPRLGERLAQIRKEKGVTQAELAQVLETIPAVISDYERGKLRLHGRVIVALAQYLNVSADELLGLKNGHRIARPTRKLTRRLEKIERLPNHQQRALIQTIDAFLKASNV